MKTAEELIGAYQATSWRSEDGNCVVLRIRDQHGQLVALKGPGEVGPIFQAGLSYRFHGHWEDHATYGRQFVFSTYTALVPHDKRGVIAYLVSLVDGVGQKRAEALWEAYGPFAVTTLRQNPEQVAEAGILPLALAQEASQTLHNEAAFESVKIDLMGMLAGRGFQVGKVLKECLRLWRHRAAEFVRRNPYLLMLKGLPSCGWKRCDQLYLDLGHPRDRLKRVTLCAMYLLKTESNGDTWLPAELVLRRLREHVGQQIEHKHAVRAVRLGRRAGKIARHQDRDGGLWLAEGAKAEHEAQVAEHIRRLCGWKRT